MSIDSVRFLREFHEDRGLRLEEIAAALHVSHMSVFNWTRQRTKPSPLAEIAIRKLAKDLEARGIQ